MQGFLTTDGHEIYTDGFDRIRSNACKRSTALAMREMAIFVANDPLVAKKAGGEVLRSRW